MPNLWWCASLCMALFRQMLGTSALLPIAAASFFTAPHPSCSRSRCGDVVMASAFNTTSMPAISLQQQFTETTATWWLPAALRRSGLWADASFSRDDAGSFTLCLLFCGTLGFLFGAGEPSQFGIPILPSEERQAAVRESSGPRLVVTDQASVRVGAQTLGEQQERQRLLVKKDRAQLTVLEAALQSERDGLEDRVAAWQAAQAQDAAERPDGTNSMLLWRETPQEYRQRLLDARVRREQRAAWLRLTLRAEEEVLAELTRLAAERGVDGPPVQPGVFPDGQSRVFSGTLGLD